MKCYYQISDGRGRAAHTATMLRYPIQELYFSSRPRNRIQSRHFPSTIAPSKSGPRNNTAVSPTVFIVSIQPTGKYPMRWIVSKKDRSSWDDSTKKVDIEQRVVDMVTDRIRPRITEGASRDNVGEGRVVAVR